MGSLAVVFVVVVGLFERGSELDLWCTIWWVWDSKKQY